MNWSLSEYSLICYGITDFDIFRHWTGEARFSRSQLHFPALVPSKTLLKLSAELAGVSRHAE